MGRRRNPINLAALRRLGQDTVKDVNAAELKDGEEGTVEAEIGWHGKYDLEREGQLGGEASGQGGLPAGEQVEARIRGGKSFEFDGEGELTYRFSICRQKSPSPS